MARQKVLVLCTGNSARSIIAEVLMNELGGDRYHCISAGSRPVGRVNPGALSVLKEFGHPVAGLRSKSWDEFAGPDAPAIDTVITVCDNAAAESCPVWNGSPRTLHWSIADPAAVEDEPARADAFRATYLDLQARISAFLRGQARG